MMVQTNLDLQFFASLIQKPQAKNNHPTHFAAFDNVIAAVSEVPFSLYKALKIKRSHPSRHLPTQVNNRNIRTRCGMCSKLTIKTPRHWRRSGVFNVNFEHISHLVLVFMFKFEHVIADWDSSLFKICSESAIMTLKGIIHFIKPLLRNVVRWSDTF